MKNAIFCNNILSIGGVEQFVYELCKKYSKDYEIVVYYKTGDEHQINRLRKYVYVEKFNNQIVETDNAFLNYDISSFLDYIKAKTIYEIVHANFMAQSNLKPHNDKRIDKYIAVSEATAKAFEERTGIKCIVCPNPLSVEMCNKPLYLCCAQRFSNEKGVNRIKRLVNELDKDSEIKYYMLIFTDTHTFSSVVNQLNSPNVAIMDNRLDIKPFIYGSDLFLTLSDSEGRCYAVGEKLSCGHGKLLITPCPSFFEQGANNDNALVMEFDMSNIKDIIEEIRKMYRHNKLSKDFEPQLVYDDWDKYLAKGKPQYTGLKHYRVKATSVYRQNDVFDNQLKRIPSEDEEFIVDGYRLQTLLNFKMGALVKVVEEIKEDQ